MYDELCAPIPDLDKYLLRLGLKRPAKYDLDFLDSMIFAHQCNIPFENLEVHEEGLQIPLSTDRLFDKIVERKRGGYCFELNALFARALEACGYDLFSVLARVIIGEDFSIPSLHRLAIVNIDNDQYVCDVGFGGAQPGFALKIEDGYSKSFCGQTFNIKKNNGKWMISYVPRSGGVEEPTMEFLTVNTEEVDFFAPNFYCCAHEDSVFVQSRFVNLRTLNGSKSIFENQFAINEDGKRTEMEITDDEQLTELLVSHFGIER